MEEGRERRVPGGRFTLLVLSLRLVYVLAFVSFPPSFSTEMVS
jgi:hypothetical protein